MSFIEITNPCTEDVNGMPKCGSNFYCGLCQKNVVDLRKSTIADAQAFVNENPDACITIHPRHAKPGLRYNFVNRVENLLLKMGMKRAALVGSTVLLFITGCNTRRHTHHPGGKPAIKEYKTLKDVK
ncbi:MAG: hypothetical protein ACHQF2_00515 [Flavobacteriales bacterium]